MTVYPEDRWVCDRCGVEVTAVPSRGGPSASQPRPDGWMHLDVSGDSLNDIDLGPLCAQLFIGWVRSGKS